MRHDAAVESVATDDGLRTWRLIVRWFFDDAAHLLELADIGSVGIDDAVARDGLRSDLLDGNLAPLRSNDDS